METFESQDLLYHKAYIQCLGKLIEIGTVRTLKMKHILAGKKHYSTYGETKVVDRADWLVVTVSSIVICRGLSRSMFHII